MNPLETEVAGLKFKNPLGLASCSLGFSFQHLKRAADEGMGFVVTKSISKFPRKIYGGTTVVVEKECAINAEGLPNPGLEKYVDEIKKFKSYVKESGNNVVLIGSSLGFDEKNSFDLDCLVEVSRGLAEAGADAIELNLSCPHSDPKKVGGLYLVAQDPSLVKEVTKEVKNAVNVPVIVKLSPAVIDIGEIAKSAEDGGADAISGINTVPSINIFTEKDREGKPKLSNIYGGLSGPAILPIALKLIYDIYKAVKIPIISYGGVTDAESLIKHIFVGARACGTVTALYMKGYPVVKEILTGLENYMKEHGFANIGEMVGLSHKWHKNLDANGKIIGDAIPKT